MERPAAHQALGHAGPCTHHLDDLGLPPCLPLQGEYVLGQHHPRHQDTHTGTGHRAHPRHRRPVHEWRVLRLPARKEEVAGLLWSAEKLGRPARRPLCRSPASAPPLPHKPCPTESPAPPKAPPHALTRGREGVGGVACVRS